MNDFDTVVISDTHLGATNSAVLKLRTFLRVIKTKQMILNGDIFDDLNFKRLNGAHFHCLRAIRKLAQRVQLTWISGNHDGGASDVLSHIIGVDVRLNMKLQVGEKIYLVLHGDIFDDIIRDYPGLTWFADWIYRLLQLLDRTELIALYLKRKSKTFIRSYDKVKGRAIEMAKRKGFHGVIVGHIHIPESAIVDGIHYVNSGSWTQPACTFIGIKDGKVELYDFDTFIQCLEKVGGVDPSIYNSDDKTQPPLHHDLQ